MIASVIPVSAAVHCYLMEPAKEEYKAMLNEISIADPCFPILSFIDTQPKITSKELIESFVNGLTSPVNFEGCVKQALQSQI